MNERQKRHYRARMPVIVPALADISVKHVREAAQRYFEAGAEYVLIPVCLPTRDAGGIRLCVLIGSTHDAKTLWQLDMNDIHDNVEMAQVVEALDSSKKWDIAELDSLEQQELKDLATLV